MYTAEGKLVSWLKASGTHVEEGQAVLEIETDKANQEVVAPASGLLHQVAAIGARLKEEDLIGYILTDGEVLADVVTTESPAGAPATGVVVKPSNAQAASPSAPTSRIFATPVARRLALQHGIDLAQLAGSGPGGRIVEADVQSALARVGGTRSSGGAALPAGMKIGGRIPLSNMRRVIGARLRQSLNTSVSLTLTREVEADRLVVARRHLNQKLGLSIPFDAFFAKFLAESLREHPEMNVIIEDDSLLPLEDAHIAVAVAVPSGLLAPVVRHADREPLAAMAKTIRDLAEQARAGQLSSTDLEGASSTISNLGGYNVDAFTPLLNPPQSTILGIGRIQARAVPRAGSVAIAEVCVLSLTFDHRVADGAPAAQLLDAIARRMNDEDYLASLG